MSEQDQEHVTVDEVTHDASPVDPRFGGSREILSARWSNEHEQANQGKREDAISKELELELVVDTKELPVDTVEVHFFLWEILPSENINLNRVGKRQKRGRFKQRKRKSYRQR